MPADSTCTAILTTFVALMQYAIFKQFMKRTRMFHHKLLSHEVTKSETVTAFLSMHTFEEVDVSPSSHSH